jgi:hypothetical protein
MSPTVVFAIAFLLSCIVKLEEAPQFQITTKRAEDQVVTRHQDDQTVLIIHSPSGIGGATIQRVAGQWPRKVAVHLQLKGLEHFRLSAPSHKVEASVSSHNGGVRVWKDGNENKPLDSKSTHWLGLHIRDADGNPTNAIPLDKGHFVLEIPSEILESNPNAIELHWIDFYRK